MREPQPAPDAGNITFDALFHRTPVQWGMRGDPHLWDALRERFRGQPVPREFWDVRDAVEAGMAEILGVDLDTELSRGTDHLQVPRFEMGSGMSDGTVSLRWWRETGIPVLIDRAGAVQAGELIPRPPDFDHLPPDYR